MGRLKNLLWMRIKFCSDVRFVLDFSIMSVVVHQVWEGYDDVL
jgi:hypothetical protein